jgi:hypothetical protein
VTQASLAPCDDAAVTPESDAGADHPTAKGLAGADHLTAADRVAAAEVGYLRARAARDRLDVALATGQPATTTALEAAARATSAEARVALARLGLDDQAALGDEDRRALAVMRHGLATVLAGGEIDGAIDDEVAEDRDRRRQMVTAFGEAAGSIQVGDETLRRLQVVARASRESDPEARRRLFLALEPLWRTVDGDAGDRSPYRALLRGSAARWASGHSPITANASALGVSAAEIEAWATRTLEAWHHAVVAPATARGEPPIEPWDWWWRAGEAERALRAHLPLARVLELNRAVYLALGADLDALGVRLDITPRPGRPPVPVAETTFGARPTQRSDGSWSSAEPTVLASYTDGGLGELAEVIHETGHAIHVAAIRTRPAFADWPDSDALTEALAELVALDTAEPAWLRHWLPDAPALPAAVSLRGRYAEVVLDAAWALFEIRLHADPGRRPNDAWTQITSRYLGIAPHPEWSWWAMRGQLLDEPGYMANYAIGAVLAADLRAAIRAARGDWTGGDPGWYAWVSDRVFRFGLERSSRDVLRDVLGREPNPDALLAEIARAGATS